MNKFLTPKLLTTTVILILLVIFYFLNNKAKTLLENDYYISNLRIAKEEDFSKLHSLSYNEIDPLLGWAMSPSQLKNRGFKILHNCIVLEHISSSEQDTFKIFITGGSTSDIALDTNCYPKHLLKLLQHDFPNLQIYVGAVGAYGSSQEVLKLLRDGISIAPDIHISYNGVNEYQSPYFVSTYEQSFFQKHFLHQQASPIYPYLSYYIKKRLNLLDTILNIKPFPTSDPYLQWKKNMGIMYALSIGMGYTFRACLQPAFGIPTEKFSRSNAITDTIILSQYKMLYPKALQYQRSNSSYILDCTKIFDIIPENVFVDDCHVKAKYQYIVADKIANIIRQSHPQ